ncbi:hypothetical protein BRYFOR_07268 [Marvinbryantia formatexigens DSM 14469]|uniref:Uncharacterized protein n=1 Tax=Marvinbryantia formatexigens DSM 14469 TaxID=478749 RepID=C6LF66_9FIRM|nr:hypothetical protein BRYFOR_07268 [Marvinbryantia formatexigens DSM 14469]
MHKIIYPLFICNPCNLCIFLNHGKSILFFFPKYYLQKKHNGCII